MNDITDKAGKLADKMNESLVGLAQTQATVAIGDAVLALVEQGQVITVDAIISHLLAEAQRQPNPMKHAQHEAAEKLLRVAQTKSH